MRSHEKLVSPESSMFRYLPSVNARNGILYLCCVGNYLYEPGYDLQRESYDSFLLAVILNGCMIFETDRQIIEAKRDDVVLLDCYKPHRYHTANGCNVLWIHFDGAPARAYYNWIHKANGDVFATRNVKKVLHCIEEIYNMMDRQQMPSEPAIAMALTTALTALIENESYPKTVRDHASAIEDVVYYINAHLDEELTVAELARKASLSEYYFIRVFCDAIGMTPRKYIIRVRLDYAKYLLKTTALSVMEIGLMIGYSSESMFCASFKKHVGATPSEFRSKVS